jgi:hypothetical protein
MTFSQKLPPALEAKLSALKSESTPPPRHINGKTNGVGQDADTPLRQEADQNNPPHNKLLGHFHGEAGFEQDNDFLVYNTIPRFGGGLIAGQWGTYKTFLVNDLAAAIIMATIDSSQRFCGEEIDYPGGVLMYLSEGEAEAPIRIQAALEKRGWPKGKPAPFVYLTPDDIPLNLSAAASVSAFIAQKKLLSAEMQKRFGVPIVASFIDTIGPLSGFTQTGEGNDDVSTTVVNMALRRIGKETDSFSFGVEHFGKAVDTGVRGSSAKEATSYCVLAALGEKDITGKVTNPRLVVRKAKGGIAGREYPFTVKMWESGTFDKKGRERTTLCIEWPVATDRSGASPKDTAPVKRWSKGLKIFRDVLIETLDSRGENIKPFADGPSVKAIDREWMREEFKRRSPAENTKAKNEAFRRAVKDAVDMGLAVTREIDGITRIWLT